MQKEKVDIDGGKSAQISNLAKKTVIWLWRTNKLHITIILLFFRYHVHILLWSTS